MSPVCHQNHLYGIRIHKDRPLYYEIFMRQYLNILKAALSDVSATGITIADLVDDIVLI